MTSKEQIKRYCCEDASKIENYEIAVNSPEKYDCHHRLETHNSDGERRSVDLTYKELIALDMYYHRPATELIFLKHGEHVRLHCKGKEGWSRGKKLGPCSEETKKKISEANKGIKRSEEFKRKMSEVHKGKKLGPRSEETRRKLSEAMKGRSQSEESNRKRSETLKERRRGAPSEETRLKMSEALKGRHWKLVDGKRVWY